MRVDAESLLARLGKNDFAYKAFTDRFSDLDLWPLFETVLGDPALAGGLSHTIDTSLAGEEAVAVTPPVAEPFSALFARYETLPAPAPVETAPRANGRSSHHGARSASSEPGRMAGSFPHLNGAG